MEDVKLFQLNEFNGIQKVDFKWFANFCNCCIYDFKIIMNILLHIVIYRVQKSFWPFFGQATLPPDPPHIQLIKLDFNEHRVITEIKYLYIQRWCFWKVYLCIQWKQWCTEEVAFGGTYLKLQNNRRYTWYQSKQ